MGNFGIREAREEPFQRRPAQRDDSDSLDVHRKS